MWVSRKQWEFIEMQWTRLHEENQALIAALTQTKGVTPAVTGPIERAHVHYMDERREAELDGKTTVSRRD